MTTVITRVSAASLEYIRVLVNAKEDGADVNPSNDTVQMAFKNDGTAPSAGDWKTAEWETDAAVSPTRYYARCLIGTGGTVALAADTYQVWVKITDSPEVPVLKAPGKLVVF